MQSKLVIASVAAMAHQAIAVSDVASTKSSSDIGSVLIGYYENCKVQVENLVGHQSVLNGQLKLTPSFEFTGIDENCPQLTATIWMEPPASCAETGFCPTTGYEVVLAPEDVRNGSWSHDFLLNDVDGSWYAHVTVSPYGFECAMAITDGCTEIDVKAACEAQVLSWDVENSLYTDEKHSATPIRNDFTWQMENLWNCNLCASWGWSSSQDPDFKAYFPKFTWDQVKTYAMQEGGAYWKGNSVQTYYPIDYSINFYDCVSGDVIFADKKTLEDPYPRCTIDSQIDITSWGEGVTTVTNSVSQDPLANCGAYGITSAVTSAGTSIAWDQAAHDDTPAKVTVASPPVLTWADLPYTIASDISHFSARLQASVGSDQATAEYWGNCDYSPKLSSFAASLVEGASYDDHRIQFDDESWSTHSGICPQFEYTITLTQDGNKYGSWDFKASDMENTSADAPHKHSTQIGVREAEYCMQLSMTPLQWYPNTVAPTVYSEKKCETIKVPECNIKPLTTFGSVLDKTTYTQTYKAWAEYDQSVWCDATRITYEWIASENDQPYENVREDTAYLYYSLQDDQQDGLNWNEPESDYQWASTFTVMYAGNLDQVSANFSDSTTWSHVISCRPKFAYTPSIEGVEADGDEQEISLSYGLLKDEACGEMWARLDIYVNSSSEPSFAINKTDDDLEPFTNVGLNSLQSDINGNLDSITVPTQAACFQVRITYGHVGNPATDVMMATDETCYVPPCVMSNAAVSVDNVAAHNGNSYNWTLSSSVNTNGWCDVVTQELAVHPCTTRQGIFLSPSDAVVPGNSSQNVIIQNRDFDCTDNLVKVVFTSTTGKQASDQINAVRPNTWGDCEESLNFTMAVNHKIDSLFSLTDIQTISGSAPPICGDVKFNLFSSASPQSANSYSDVKTKTWQLDSKTGEKCYHAKMIFSNLPGEEHDIESVCVGWTQACQLSIEDASFTGFTTANDATNTSGTATVQLRAIATGDCGSTFAYEATLDCLTDNVLPYKLELTDAIFSDKGMSITQDIPRDVKEYQLVFNVSATSAQTAEEHQAMTIETGFENQISDSAVTTASSLPDPCSLEITSVDWVSFAEEDQYRGPMLSTWSGVIVANSECTSLFTTIKLKPGVDTAAIQSYDIPMSELKMQANETYTFTHTFSHPNVAGNYSAHVWAHDASNEANQDDRSSDNNEWNPPCYLEIVNFAKNDQSDSLDQLRTTLDYNLAIAEHGDNACRATAAKIELKDSTGVTFVTHLDNNDILQAQTEEGFSLSIQTEASEADTATATISDPRAVASPTADAVAYVAPASYACDVQVVDFCLTDFNKVADGRYGFDFTIRVEANAKCGTLTATMDLVQDGTFMGGVSLDGADIVDVFDCQCEKVFTVYADYDGMGEEMYGQMDIRNGQQQVVKIVDSCTKEIGN